jgi:hypothetical protein
MQSTEAELGKSRKRMARMTTASPLNRSDKFLEFCLTSGIKWLPTIDPLYKICR